jgi:signal transduction histidine kinase
LQDALQAAHAVIVDKIANGPQWIEPLPQFSQAAIAVGHAQAPLDADSVCRRYPVRELTLDGSRWAFAVEVARRVDAKATSEFLASYGLQDEAHPSVITAEAILVPIPFQRGAFTTISARKVLEGLDPAFVRGKPVLVGFGTTEIGDRLSTPLHPEFPTPGVEVHAQILDGILSGRALRRFPLWIDALLLLTTCVLAVALFRSWRGFAAVGVFAVMASAVYAVGFVSFVLASRILPAGPMMLAVTLAPLLVYTADFVLVERSLTQQLLGLRSWLALRGKETGTREREDLSWRLSLLEQLQTELGSLYELHSALLESTQDLIAIFDEQGKLLLKNRAFAQAYGLQSNSPFTLEQTRSRWLRGEGGNYKVNGDAEEREVSLDKELYSVRVLPLPSTSLSPKGGTIVTLTNLRTRVERDRARAESLGFITHELRTPLTLMLGPIEEFVGEPQTLHPHQRERIKIVHRNGMRLLKLVNSLLDFSRIEAGRSRAVFEPTDLAMFMAELASNFQSATQRAGLALRIDCPPQPQPVYVDREMWEKIVLNLLSNAFKFTFEGRIEVVLQQREDFAELVVRDTGTGIPQDELPRLFERFHRVEGARGRSFEGSGIGLALVKELIDLHAGSIRVESREGRGTSFFIRIPLGRAHLPSAQVRGARVLEPTVARAQAFVEEALRWLPEGAVPNDAIEGEASDLAGRSAASHYGRARVVVADDNADMRDYICRLLRAGHDCEAVGDGEAALEAIRRQRPDLVVTDVMMPRMDGRLDEGDPRRQGASRYACHRPLGPRRRGSERGRSCGGSGRLSRKAVLRTRADRPGRQYHCDGARPPRAGRCAARGSAVVGALE